MTVVEQNVKIIQQQTRVWCENYPFTPAHACKLLVIPVRIDHISFTRWYSPRLSNNNSFGGNALEMSHRGNPLLRKRRSVKPSIDEWNTLRWKLSECNDEKAVYRPLNGMGTNHTSQRCNRLLVTERNLWCVPQVIQRTRCLLNTVSDSLRGIGDFAELSWHEL